MCNLIHHCGFRVILFGIAVCMSVGHAGAQDGSLRPTFWIDESAFEEIVHFLSLSEAQLAAAERILAQYQEQLEEMKARNIGGPEFARFADLSRAATAVRREGRDPDYGPVDAAHREFLAKQQVRRAEEDRLLATFVEELAPILSDEQVERAQRLPLLVRRLSHYRIAGGGRQGSFTPNIILFVVLRDAALKGILGDWADERLTVEYVHAERPGMPAAKAELFGIMRDYETALDSLIRQRYTRTIPPPGEQSAVLIAGTSGWRRHGNQRWKFIHLNHMTALRIADLLRHHEDEEATTRWIDAYHQALVPGLFVRWWPDRLVDWLQTRDDATDEQLHESRLLYADYLAQRSIATRSAIDHGIVATRQQYVAWGNHERETRLYHDRLRALQKLVEDTVRRFRDLLNDEQRAALDAAIELERLQGPGLWGPYIYE